MSNRNANARHRTSARRKAKPAQKPPLGDPLQTVQLAIRLAVQPHTAGDLPRAEQIYQQILQSNPSQPDALHLLGVIAHQVGKNKVAVELISKAIAVRPDFAAAHGNLGNALRPLGRLQEAIASFNKSISTFRNAGLRSCKSTRPLSLWG
jgi:tetratricopeptide (TPR) repeat protein